MEWKLKTNTSIGHAPVMFRLHAPPVDGYEQLWEKSKES